MRFLYEPAKRAFDLLVGSILLITTVPLILIAAVAIRLETPGSPFFTQTRLGRDGKPFRLCKLRGMYSDARGRFPSHYDYSCKQDLDFCFHHEEDPRVTRAGMFIRKTSIDELPQLWNVLRGEMSLVGPRPLPVYEVAKIEVTSQRRRLSVKPGITGWAQLSYPYGASELDALEKLQYDLYYIKNGNLLFDIAILVQTAEVVLMGKGAR